MLSWPHEQADCFYPPLPSPPSLSRISLFSVSGLWGSDYKKRHFDTWNYSQQSKVQLLIKASIFINYKNKLTLISIKLHWFCLINKWSFENQCTEVFSYEIMCNCRPSQVYAASSLLSPPPHIIHHSDRPFHSWIQNSGWKTTLNTQSCPRLVRTSLPSRRTPGLNFSQVGEPDLSDRGKLWQMMHFLSIFTHFFFLHMKIWNFPAEGDLLQQL